MAIHTNQWELSHVAGACRAGPYRRGRSRRSNPVVAVGRDGDGFLLADQNDQPLAARDAGIEQITLQHGVVLRHDRGHHRWVFRPLALVDGCSVGRHQGVEFAEAIGDRALVEFGGALNDFRSAPTAGRKNALATTLTECSIQIGNQIVAILDTNRNPYQIIGDAERSANLTRRRGMRHQRR